MITLDQLRQKMQFNHSKKAHAAKALWDQATTPNPSHPYLLAKRLNPLGLQQINDALIVPVYSIEGKIQSLQFINGMGQKLFFKGAMIKAGFSDAQPYDEGLPIVVSEGWAPSQSLQQQWDMSGWHICVFSTNNLVTVAADNDMNSISQTCDKLAAQSANATEITPRFSEKERTLQSKYSDTNDRYLLDHQEVNHA